MKGFRLLPIAQSTYAVGTDNRKIKKAMSFMVLVLVIPAMIISLLLKKFGIFMILIGATVIIRQFFDSEKFIVNGQKMRNYILLDYVIYGVGLFVIILGISVCVGKNDDQKSVEVLAVLFFGTIVLWLVGRLIFLTIKAAAISKRKKECTEIISAEHNGYKDTWNLVAASGYDISLVGDPVYEYYYNGEIYKLVIIENVPARYDKNGSLELFVDPKHPERYYSKELFIWNTKKIKFLLKVALFLLVVSAAILGIMFSMV